MRRFLSLVIIFFKDRVYSFLAIFTILFFAFLAGFALLHPGLPPTHDGEYHIIRFYEFDKILRNGILYPRWAPDLNYGYGVPLFNFVYPLPNYVSFVLHLFGISFIDAFKLNMFFATIIGSAFFYLWAKRFWGTMGGVVSSVFYTYSPYHFVDVYIRGSVGEVWALAFFSAFLWSVTKFIVQRQKIFFILSSLLLALTIFSHNILALMFFFFALSYIGFLIYRNDNRRYLTLNTIFIILVGLGLSAVFWLPAIYESKYVTGLQIFDVSAHFPDLYQLLIPSWGSGFSGGEVSNQLSFQIGVANLAAVFLSIIVLIVGIKNKKKNAFILFFLFWFALVFFLILSVSNVFWQIIPFMSYFQFPWRFLSLEIIFTSFLAGSIFCLRLSFLKIPLTLFLIFFVFVLGLGYMKPAYYHYRNDSYYIARSNFMDGTNSPGNVFNTIWMNKGLNKEKEKIKFLKGKGSIEKKEIKTEFYAFKINAYSLSKIQVNTAYFPGWEIKVNKNQVKTQLDDNGLFYFYLPEGNHNVEIRFTNTPIRNIAILLSFISFTIISVLFIKYLFVTIKK